MFDKSFTSEELAKLKSFTTAGEFISFSCEFYAKKEHAKSQLCDQYALDKDPNNAVANYNIGICYLYGKGTSGAKDLNKARMFFEKSAKLGYQNAEKRLADLEALKRNWTTEADWNALGVKYHDGDDGIAVNYHQALYCYDKALAINPNHNHALSNKAMLFQYGKGVDLNLDMAEELYKKARANGHKKSVERLLTIEMKKMGWDHADANLWYRLGLMYDAKIGDRTQDREKERICYEKAIQLDAKLYSAYYALGIMHFQGEDLTLGQNSNTAKGYFKIAADSGYEPAQKKMTELDNIRAREDALLLSSLITLAGVGLVFTPAAPLGGILLNVGLGGGVSAYKDEGATFSYDSYVRENIISGVVGLVPLGVGTFLKPGLATTIIKGAASSVTQDVLKNGQETTLESLGKSVLCGGVIGGAGHAATGVVNAVGKESIENMLQESADDALRLVNIGMNGLSSGAGSAAGKVTSNILNGKEISEGLLESTLLGASQGALISLGQSPETTKKVIVKKGELDSGSKAVTIAIGKKLGLPDINVETKNGTKIYLMNGKVINVEQAKAALLDGKNVTVQNGEKDKNPIEVNVWEELNKLEQAKKEYDNALAADRAYRQNESDNAAIISGLNQKGSHANSTNTPKPEALNDLKAKFADALLIGNCVAALAQLQNGLTLPIDDLQASQGFGLAIKNRNSGLANYLILCKFITLSIWIAKQSTTNAALIAEYNDFIFELALQHEDKASGSKLLESADLIEKFLNQYKKDSYDPQSVLIKKALVLAAKWGELALLKKAIQKEINLKEIQDEHGKNLMSLAVYHGQIDVVSWLITQGFEANWDLAYLATEQQHEAVFQVLYEYINNKEQVPDRKSPPAEKTSSPLPKYSMFNHSQDIKTEMIQTAKRYGFSQCEPVDGDGNCFYYVLIDQLTEKTTLANSSPLNQWDTLEKQVFGMRHLICEYAEKSPQEIESFFPVDGYENLNDFLIKVKQTGTYATDLEISILAKIFKLTLVIVRHDGRVNVIKNNSSEHTLYLGYEDHQNHFSHYWSLRGSPNIDLCSDARRYQSPGS